MTSSMSSFQSSCNSSTVVLLLLALYIYIIGFDLAFFFSFSFSLLYTIFIIPSSSRRENELVALLSAQPFCSARKLFSMDCQLHVSLLYIYINLYGKEAVYIHTHRHTYAYNMFVVCCAYFIYTKNRYINHRWILFPYLERVVVVV